MFGWVILPKRWGNKLDGLVPASPLQHKLFPVIIVSDYHLICLSNHFWYIEIVQFQGDRAVGTRYTETKSRGTRLVKFKIPTCLVVVSRLISHCVHCNGGSLCDVISGWNSPRVNHHENEVVHTCRPTMPTYRYLPVEKKHQAHDGVFLFTELQLCTFLN